MKEKRQVQCGAILSYALVFLNALYSLFLTPYIIGMIGETSYGVYKTISSFTASFMILDMGFGGAMMRYIAKYRSDKDERKIPNFIAMGLVQITIVCFVVGMVALFLYFSVDDIYANGLTANELDKAKQLYVFLACGVIAHIIGNFFNGIISGYNRFAFSNGIKVIRLLFRIFAIIVLLRFFKDPVTIVLIDLSITSIFTLIEILYLKLILKVNIKFSYWDKDTFGESFRYMLLLFLSSMVAQANTNFSNIIIGAKINSLAVTTYSMALLIFAAYQQMSTAISGVMLPTVMNTLKEDDNKYTKTTTLIIKTGRIQFLLLGAILAGFIVLGRNFVSLWLGHGYEDVYSLEIILLSTSLFELCVNVCLCILRAKNKLVFRTLIDFTSGVLTILVTLMFINKFGYWAAAIGTASGMLICNVVIMGIYYYKSMGINILQIYKKIFSKIWICISVSAVGSFLISLLIAEQFTKFIVSGITFVLIYAVTLWLFGLNKEEKGTIFSIVRRNKK